MSCSSWVMMESFVEGLWWKELLVCREQQRLRGCSSTSPSSRQSSVINIDRYKVHLTCHVASQLAGNDRCDPPLAGAGFVIPARRCPPGLLVRLPIYYPTCLIHRRRQSPRKKPTAAQDKMASTGQQYYELYRRSRYIALHRTLLYLHRSG